MKKIFFAIFSAITLFGTTSCSDMLETESSRAVTDPALNQKVDSVYMAYGVLQAVQQLADQYYFQNEMRGDLVSPTINATTHLKQLADFSAGSENKYDSVYRYYKVINNCNYYLAHRDTTLVNSDTARVAINEYLAIAAIRAWAYLQLTHQYGDVPYIEKPLMAISEINAQQEKVDYQSILVRQAEYLQNLMDKHVVDEDVALPFFQASVTMGHPNFNTTNRTYVPTKCFIPLQVVLGDLYLETGEYKKAASTYFKYLKSKAKKGVSNIGINFANRRAPEDNPAYRMPLDYNPNASGGNTTLGNGPRLWNAIFNGNDAGAPVTEIITYVPMAVNYMQGQTTEVPMAFGYDYYANSRSSIAPYSVFGTPEMEKIQVIPSEEYNSMSNSAPYYYYTLTQDPDASDGRYLMSSANIGDGRANFICHGAEQKYSSLVFTQKPATAFFYLYRMTTVWMHLAEALNRMGEPQLAFAVLKSGIHDGIKAYVDTAYVSTGNIDKDNYYIPYDSYKLLKTPELGFCAPENATYFTNEGKKSIVGVHFHGAGAVEDIRSPYQYKAIVEARIDAIREKFGVGQGAYTDQEYVNAVEDILCDEYAMEFAFEGTRFSDLIRIARHKNMKSAYGAGFGDKWLSKKLESKGKQITTQNCYLPFN